VTFAQAVGAAESNREEIPQSMLVTDPGMLLVLHAGGCAVAQAISAPATVMHANVETELGRSPCAPIR
jgi:hypothetical protein